MKKRLIPTLGLLIYIVLLVFILQFDVRRMVQPVPLISVLAGVVILTLFQYKKGTKLPEILLQARWNAYIAGLLTTLFQLLLLLEEDGISMDTLAEKSIPLVYGSLIGLAINIVLTPQSKGEDSVHEQVPVNLFSVEIAYPVFTARGFSARECHVALKLLEGTTNKEIGAQLFISEATVKKHIQNMFKKCGAADRQDFVTRYIRWAGEYVAGRM